MLNMQGRVLNMDSCAGWDVYVRRDSPQRLSSKEVTLRCEFQVPTIMAQTLLTIFISVFKLIAVFFLLQWTDNYARRLYWMHVYTYDEFKAWGAENMVASGHSLVQVSPCTRRPPRWSLPLCLFLPVYTPPPPSAPVSPGTRAL